MFRLVVIFGLLSIQVQGQQLESLHSEAPQNAQLVSIRQLAGRKTRIAQDLSNVTLAIWGDVKENYLFGEKYRELLGPATFASFDARVHYLNYGFFYILSNENIRFIPLPTGHHCHGRWLQYGKIRGIFFFYDGQYRFGSFCLDTGAIAFLDKHGQPIVFESQSEAKPAPHQHNGFYQICIGKNRQPVTPLSLPVIPIPPNPINHFPSVPNHPTLIPAPQGQNNSQEQNSLITYNFGCDNGEFSSFFDCVIKRNGQKQSNKPIPSWFPLITSPIDFTESRASQNQDSPPSYAQVPPSYPFGSGKDAYDFPPIPPPFEQQNNAGKTEMLFSIFLGIPILLSIL
ncbi:unnamed protein product, partial [Mesorhabditis belari]|uniref:Uncharacterized protein n=1 Tax=Mesorhabditis belari TaxID=2138241 RepID=A0AAF3FK03_9BILA